ncbi:SRPBCC domain-containing protein [Novosphingobium sp. 9]|uniref:SRPBCC domain-containing protein n=1 Tax=Novosphingobium sp. 9 TaxID=2025349 RepID=UPI0021B6C2C4|nr:SRPBCC domain-containing protein [Novosphingobium sp. 9]
MNAIFWPEGYIPGFADNFASNEMIVAGLTADQVWPLLANAEVWPSYYANCADIAFPDGNGPVLAEGTRFFFRTFGFPVDCEVTEYVAPQAGAPGRVAWHGWSGEGDERLDVHHAWLIEDIEGGRVRVLTQETQNGNPAKALAAAVPNPMINGHDEWLRGMLAAAREGLAQA